MKFDETIIVDGTILKFYCRVQLLEAFKQCQNANNDY